MKTKKNDKEKIASKTIQFNSKIRRKEAVYWIVIALLSLILLFLLAKSDDRKNKPITAIEQEAILNHVQNIDHELKVLEKSKDSVVIKQAKKLKEEIEKIKKKLENSQNLSYEQQLQLQKELNQLQKELKRITEEYQAYQENISLNIMDMIDIKEKEIKALKEENEQLKKTLMEECSKINKEIVFLNKQSQVNFNVVTLSKKNIETTKAKYVYSIWCNLKINGDLDVSNIDKLRIQITDPLGNVITKPEDFMVLKKNTNEYSTFQFIPENYKFMAGMYMIRAYSADGKIDVSYALNLR